jgi:hypothetical protein
MGDTMQVMGDVERKGDGMPDRAFMKTYWTNVGGKRFISRWILFRTDWFSIEISRIHRADDMRADPHDHSRSFISIKLIGSYDEYVYYNPNDLSQRRERTHSWLSWHLMRYNMAHSIIRVSPILITMTILGCKKQASSYWREEGKVLTGVNGTPYTRVSYNY